MYVRVHIHTHALKHLGRSCTSYKKYKIMGEVEEAIMPKKQKELNNKNILKNLREMREDMKRNFTHTIMSVP